MLYISNSFGKSEKQILPLAESSNTFYKAAITGNRSHYWGDLVVSDPCASCAGRL